MLAPLDAIVPTLASPPPIPFTSQAMLAPAAMQNDAVNDCVWPSATLAEEGAIEFVVVQVMVALALPDFELSAALAAVTVTVAGEGGTPGAV